MNLSYFRARLSTGFRLFAAIVLLCGAGAVLSSAQVLRSSITGRVSDASGAAVAAATITVTNQQTGVAAHTTTDNSGNYTVPELDPGLYSVAVEKTGFTQQTATGIQLLAEQTLRSDMKLKIGSVTESVQVSGQSGLINTENGTISTAITMTQLKNLPTALQDIDSFLILAAGVGRASLTRHPRLRAVAIGEPTTLRSMVWA